ncbi:MAG: DNA topoisomerase VI, partial [Candidatus Methanoperedenaceae archaeon]|nr:DNA topoisomerase VI [Candidatus Methanoperedenaceae archaeon]
MDDYRKIRDSMAKKRLKMLIQDFYEQFESETIPNIVLPSRTKKNIELDEDSDVWVYGDSESMRSAKTVKGAKQILKTAHVVELLIKGHLEENRSSTLRELYYISENWDIAKFNEQSESDRFIEDLEIISEMQREDFHVRPEENGATLFGPIKIKETTKRGERTMHCQDEVGEAGYQIPYNVESVEFLEHDAKFIIAIETGGM